MAEKMATREAYGKVLKELGPVMEDLVVMDADLSGSTKSGEFAKVCPDRFFNMGIAEQDLYGAAAGLAAGHAGKRPDRQRGRHLAPALRRRRL